MPKFREISGQFVGYIPDSIDSDIVPDRAPMSGRVTFSPVFTGGVIAFPELSPPEFAHPRTIHARIVDGFVQVEVNEGEGDDEHIALQPLSLMVTVDDEASQVWSWRADFDEILIGASDEYVQIPSWSFRVPDGTGPVDLTELVPLKSGGTVDVTKGPRGAGLQNITAVDGQLVFEYTDGEETVIPMPEAVQGPPGADGAPGPQGETGEQGPEGPQGPAPDLLVGNITDATPTGKNLMLAATEGAARNALGLQTGATSIAGSLEELNNGTQTNSRVWSPKNISDYVEERVESSKVFVNVKDHGAKADGITDDSAAAQEALNHVASVGGGTVLFPEGTYFWDGIVEVHSNTTIEGRGAVFVKKPGQGNTMLFGIYSRGDTGYGSGATNVTFRGLHLRGSFADERQIGLLGANHGDNILIEDCVFEQAHIQGHIIDLGGCRRVTVRRCVFLGQHATVAADPTKECVQADNSTRLGASNGDDAGSYDGLPSQDIKVSECSFLPLSAGGVDYPSPVPFGTHYGVNGYMHERLTFENNLVVDPASNTSSSYRGVLHFCAASGITIRGNRFVSSTASNVPVIRNIPLTGTIEPGDADTATGSTVSLTNHVQSVGWEISGNVFEGFSAQLDPQNIVHVSGTVGGTRVKGVTISGNVFVSCYTPPMDAGTGPLPINAYDVDDLVVTGNRYDTVRNAVSTGRSSNVSVSGNSVRSTSSTTAIVAGPSSVVSISGNSLYSVMNGIRISASTSGASVSGNIVNASSSGVVVDGAASGVSVVGNSVTGTANAFALSGEGYVSVGNMPAS